MMDIDVHRRVGGVVQGERGSIIERGTLLSCQWNKCALGSDVIIYFC